MTITITADNTKIGQNTTITATVKDEYNQIITDEELTFTIAGQEYTTSITDSTATYTTTKTLKDKTITATFQDNDAFNTNTQEINITKVALELKVDTTTFTIGQNATLQQLSM